MINVKTTKRMILLQGHAADHDTCGLFSGLCVGINEGFALAGEAPDVSDIADGCFYINLEELKTNEGKFLAKLLLHCIKEMAEEHPDSFKEA